jgi:FixJ family two-component response regulator
LVDLDRDVERTVTRLVHRGGVIAAIPTTLAALQEGEALQQAGCIVLPISGEAASLPIRLYQRPSPIQVVYLALELDVHALIAATRNGANNILAWPDDADRLADAVAEACRASTAALTGVAQCLDARRKLAQLSVSECEVVDRMLAGEPNKKIAAQLDMAIRTVELRRKQIFAKLDTRSVADIYSMIQRAGRTGVGRNTTPPHGIPTPHYLSRGETPSPAVREPAPPKKR